MRESNMGNRKLEMRERVIRERESNMGNENTREREREKYGK